MDGFSLIVYNLFLDQQFECLYVSNIDDCSKEIETIFQHAHARQSNGIIVCTIEGDWREMNVEEISVKCCQNIREELKW